jgi:hypothetical protein
MQGGNHAQKAMDSSLGIEGARHNNKDNQLIAGLACETVIIQLKVAAGPWRSLPIPSRIALMRLPNRDFSRRSQPEVLRRVPSEIVGRASHLAARFRNRRKLV